MINSSRVINDKIIYNDRITRSAYSRDASMYRLMPKSVVKPRNINDIKDLLYHARSSNTPITFRAGGTSLSGQSVTNGIIAEILHEWKNLKILKNGDSIFMQAGVNAGYANSILSSYKKKLGPDPASINSASIGGILSNNSSGMVCGTKYNSYHTLENITFILPNGNMYDTSKNGEKERFITNEKIISDGLIKIRKKIISSSKIVNKIRDKYRIKNTIGYSMNAFLDYENPIEIFAHLLIGSEGTLGFIVNATLKTVPDPPNRGTGLMIFKNPEEAGKSIPFFKDLGADAIEFLDDASLKTAKHFQNAPYDAKSIKDDFTGILFEYQRNSSKQINHLLNETKLFSKNTKSAQSLLLVTDKKERDLIWKIRKGLYPTIGALRKSGKSIITEDIAFDMENIAPAIRGLKTIFKNRKLHDGVIFGHAKDGNLHFITSLDFNSKKGVDNYDLMMKDLSEMTLNKFNGSLKAEHGTGRNMAPFVQTEWGGVIYDFMWELKRLVDPLGIMNPDVLLAKDSRIHLKNIKLTPKVHKEVDSCVECGFCENICPSRGLTFTPRQRIGIMREIKSFDLTKKEKEILEHGVNNTCATDGLCSLDCPVNINTGLMVKDLRTKGELDPWVVKKIAENFKVFISGIRFLLSSLNFLHYFLGKNIFDYFSTKLNKISKNFIPIWPKVGMRVSRKHKSVNHIDPDYLLFSTCVNRVLSGDNKNISSSEYLIKIAEKSGIKILEMKESLNLCCGMPFSSKGYKSTGNMMKNKLLNEILEVSKEFKKPIIVDMSPCAENLITELKDSRYEILDSVTFLNNIKGSLKLNKLDETFYGHTVCSSQKMDDSNSLKSIVKSCVKNYEFPVQDFCCGMGGDRGLRYPDLPENSINKSINGIQSSFGVSSSRTCEKGLSQQLNIDFISVEALVYKSIKK